MTEPNKLLPPQGSRHLIAIDINDIIRRAWHGHVNDRRNEPERAAPTAIRAIARLLRGQQPSHVLCAGEGVGSVRKDAYDLYKANRPPKPDGLMHCEAQVETALRTAYLPIHAHVGLEADDVIHGAVLATRVYGRRHGLLPVVIATRDKDLEWLVHAESKTVVLNGDTVLDENAVRAKWGVEPHRIADILALAGDTSDNIPHVKGWGPTAAKKILGTSSLDLLLLPDGYWYVPEKYRAAFRDNRDMIRMAYGLVKLRGESIEHKFDIDEMECNALAAAESLMNSADGDGAW